MLAPLPHRTGQLVLLAIRSHRSRRPASWVRVLVRSVRRFWPRKPESGVLGDSTAARPPRGPGGGVDGCSPKAAVVASRVRLQGQPASRRLAVVAPASGAGRNSTRSTNARREWRDLRQLGTTGAYPCRVPASATSDLRLLDVVGDAVLVVDHDGVVVDASGDVEAGSSLFDLIPRAHESQRKAVIARVLDTGSPLRFTDRIDGRWTEVIACPAAVGERVIFVHRDIDARIRDEEELKRLRLRVLTIQEEERRVIAQDLHDEVGQGMTALLMQLRGLAVEAQDVSEGVRGGVRDSTQQVETLIKRMRQLFYRLRPPPLEASPLPEALGDYCASFAHFSRLRVEFDADQTVVNLDDPQAVALYRLLQECLNNVVKHANATSAWVSLSREARCVSLAVEDDGSGFDPETASPGSGLNGLRERFALLDGNVEVEARSGVGVRVTGSVPLAAEAPQ